jgi:hypothetical protein
MGLSPAAPDIAAIREPFNDLQGNCSNNRTSAFYAGNKEAPMSTRLILLLVVTAAFGVLTAIALMDVGYWGIIAPHFQAWGPGQVFADLVIALTLVMVWMVSDSRTSGVNAWPFVAVTLALGSFGPLFYLIARELKATSVSRQSA